MDTRTVTTPLGRGKPPDHHAVVLYDSAAEQAILGALLLDAAATPPAWLEPGMFQDIRHREIFRAALAIREQGLRVDPVTLRSELEGRGLLDTVGGLEYIASVIDTVPTAAHIADHAAIVRRHALKRELREWLGCLSNGAGPETIDSAMARIPECLRALRDSPSAQAFSPPVLADFVAENPATVTWVIDGLAVRGAVSIIAGHPKAGKTTLCAELAGMNAAGANFIGTPTEGGSVLWIDLEQPKGLTASVLGAHCAPSAPIHVQWGSLPDLEAAGAFCQKAQVNLVFVDSWTKARKGVEDANDEVQTTRAMQPWLDFARTYNIAVVFIHHLRKSGGSEGLDLRGSGALAACVDIVAVFKRYAPEADTDSRRTIEVFSRYGNSKRVIDRVDGRYRLCGTPGQVRRQAERDKVLGVLTDQPQSSEEVAISAEMGGSATRTVLKLLSEEGLIGRTGSGVKKDKFLYTK